MPIDYLNWAPEFKKAHKKAIWRASGRKRPETNSMQLEKEFYSWLQPMTMPHIHAVGIHIARSFHQHR